MKSVIHFKSGSQNVDYLKRIKLNSPKIFASNGECLESIWTCGGMEYAKHRYISPWR